MNAKVMVLQIMCKYKYGIISKFVRYGYGTIDLLKAVTIAKEMYGRK